MFHIASGSAKTAEKLIKKKKDRELRVKELNGSFRGSLRGSFRLSKDMSWSDTSCSTLTVDEIPTLASALAFPSSPQKSSRKFMDLDCSESSSVWDEQLFEKPTEEEHRRARVVSVLQAKVKEWTQHVETLATQLKHAKRMVEARMDAKSSVALALSINEAKRVVADKTGTEKALERLQTYMFEVVNGEGSFQGYQDVIQKIQAEEREQPVEVLSIHSCDSLQIRKELRALGISFKPRTKPRRTSQREEV